MPYRTRLDPTPFERADDTVYVVLASRVVTGKTYEYSCTKGSSTDGAGVAVRGQGGDWLARYHYENEKENEKKDDSQKMSGTDEDVKKLRSTVAELASVVMNASR